VLIYGLQCQLSLRRVVSRIFIDLRRRYCRQWVELGPQCSTIGSFSHLLGAGVSRFSLFTHFSVPFFGGGA